MSGATQNEDCGRVSAILRRLLCAGSLQTHPSDQIAESKAWECDHSKKDLERGAKTKAPAPKRVVHDDTPAIAPPGIVARLMGLDSLPVTKWVPRERVPDSVTRSRSVNFTDYFMELDLGHSRHRRVRTSVSFREVPTSFLQNQDLLVLCLGNVDETEEVGLPNLKGREEEGLRNGRQRDGEKRKKKEKSPEIVITKKKKKENQANNAKISALKNEPRRHVSAKHFPNADAISKDKCVDSRKKTKKKEENLAVNNEIDKVCHSEYSSSTPVLDDKFLEYILLETNPVDSIPTKRSPTTTKCDSPSPYPAQVVKTDELSLRAIKQANPDDQYQKEYSARVVSELCRLTKEDVEESNWTTENGFAFEAFEGICRELGQTILDQQVHLLVGELV